MVQVAYLSALILVLATQPAQAYIDPGTGGMILQAIAATAVGLMVTMRLYWAKVRSFFSPKNPEK